MCDLDKREWTTETCNSEVNHMDEARYREWWPLHLRVASGERLTPDEEASYDSSLRELHQEELSSRDVGAVRRARDRVAALAAENEKLREERDQLETQIAALEETLNDEARHLLGVGR